MAKHKSLLVGSKCTGSIGGNLCFTTWKGIGIVKEKPEPSNPNTVAQQAVRTGFTANVDEWHDFARSIADAVAYNVLAGRDSRPLSGFNIFMSIYMIILEDGDDECYFRDGDATRVTTTLTFTADVNEDILYKCTVYNKDHVPVAEDTDTAVAGAISIAVTIPATVTEGYAVCEAAAVGYGGKSGLYDFI